jgi:protein subunit release factor B
MAVSKEKLEDLRLRMERLEIREEDLIEKFVLGSGSGGQKINKTSSCVYLKHAPSGVEVKCQKDRSREMNRFYARRDLCEKLEELLFKEKSEKQQLIEKIRRQKRRKTRKQKQKMIEDKRVRSEKKSLRKPPRNHEG